MANTPPTAPVAPDLTCIKKQQTVINMLALLLTVVGAKKDDIEKCIIK